MKAIKCSLFACLCWWLLAAYAGPPGKSGDLSLGRAASIAEHRTGGRALAAEKRKIDGRLMYRVKILTPKGRVRNVYIDPSQEQRRQR